MLARAATAACARCRSRRCDEHADAGAKPNPIARITAQRVGPSGQAIARPRPGRSRSEEAPRSEWSSGGARLPRQERLRPTMPRPGSEDFRLRRGRPGRVSRARGATCAIGPARWVGRELLATGAGGMLAHEGMAWPAPANGPCGSSVTPSPGSCRPSPSGGFDARRDAPWPRLPTVPLGAPPVSRPAPPSPRRSRRPRRRRSRSSSSSVTTKGGPSRIRSPSTPFALPVPE